MSKINKPLLKSIKTKKIKTTNIKKISTLKSKHYKFSIKEHVKWYKKNIRFNDIHNMLFFENKLVGYNCLRKMENLRGNILKDIILFDTLIIDPEFRKKGLSEIIMKKSNYLIKKNKSVGLLFCKRNMFKYYSKFKWQKLKKNQVKTTLIKKKTLYPMIFNFIKRNKKNINIEFDIIS